MIKDQITISKDKILKKYSKLNSFFKESIEALYGASNSTIETYDFSNIEEEIINRDCRKNEHKNSPYCSLKDKTGVYVFIENSIPVYIGVAGTESEDDLIVRLNAETHSYPNWNNATLSKNIQEIDSILYNKTVTENDTLEKIKSFTLKVLVIGPIIDDNKKKSLMLEQLLISLFNSKYQ